MSSARYPFGQAGAYVSETQPLPYLPSVHENLGHHLTNRQPFDSGLPNPPQRIPQPVVLQPSPTPSSPLRNSGPAADQLSRIPPVTSHPRAIQDPLENSGPEPPLSEDANRDLVGLKRFLLTAPLQFSEGDIIRQYRLADDEQVSCVRWNQMFYITGTDIVRCLIHRFAVFGREIVNRKKFEEGVFSDLRNLKINSDAILESPKSELLEFLYKRGCVRTKKKQKVFFWYSVHHERLFIDALERELKREIAYEASQDSPGTSGASPTHQQQQQPQPQQPQQQLQQLQAQPSVPPPQHPQQLGPDQHLHQAQSQTQQQQQQTVGPASTVAVREPALSFRFDTTRPLAEQLATLIDELPGPVASYLASSNSGTSCNSSCAKSCCNDPRDQLVLPVTAQVREGSGVSGNENYPITPLKTMEVTPNVLGPWHGEGNAGHRQLSTPPYVQNGVAETAGMTSPERHAHAQRVRPGRATKDTLIGKALPVPPAQARAPRPAWIPDNETSSHGLSPNSLLVTPENETDFPLDILNKEDQVSMRPERQSQFDSRFMDFAYNNRPALSHVPRENQDGIAPATQTFETALGPAFAQPPSLRVSQGLTELSIFPPTSRYVPVPIPPSQVPIPVGGSPWLAGFADANSVPKELGRDAYGLPYFIPQVQYSAPRENSPGYFAAHLPNHSAPKHTGRVKKGKSPKFSDQRPSLQDNYLHR